MKTYRAFGLCIGSEVIMPEFLPVSGAPDITVERGDVAPPAPIPRSSRRTIHASPGGIFLHWRDIGSFLVEAGERVTVAAHPGVDDALLRLVLTGPVLGVLLAQRDYLAFHAAVVAHPDERSAIAIVGAKGMGKSTMAAALYNAGCPMMSDDIMAVVPRDDRAFTQAGFPHAKLWKTSARALVARHEKLAALAPGFGKRARPVRDRFLDAILPLRAVLVLDEGRHISLEQLVGFESIQALLPHWYGALFDGQLLPVLGADRHLRETSWLAQNTEVYRLVRPWSLRRVADVADEVVRAFFD